MHLLKYDPDARTLTEVMPGEFAADPTCRYFYVEGKRAAVPILTHDGIGEIVWEHPSYQPPSPANQHRATDEQWHWQAIKELLPENPRSPLPACLLELRDRIEALEAAQHAHITWPSEAGIKAAELEWARTAPGMRSDDRMLALQDRIRDGALTLADALKEIGAPEPAPSPRPSTLVDRVADAIDNTPLGERHRAAIREVAAWLQENPGPNSAWRAVARDLMDEANR